MFGLDADTSTILAAIVIAIWGVLLWFFVGKPMMNKAAGNAFRSFAQSKDEKDVAALNALGDVLIDRMLVQNRDVGIKNDKGEPVLVSAIQIMASQIGETAGRGIEMRIKGALGVDAHMENTMQRALANDMLAAENPQIAMLLEQFPQVKKLIQKDPRYAAIASKFVGQFMGAGAPLNSAQINPAARGVIPR